MVILLSGPDTYRSLRRLQQLRGAFRDKHDPSGLNTVTLDGDVATAVDVRDALMSSGLFAARRMVILDPYDPKRAALKPTVLNGILESVVKGEMLVVVVRDITVPSTDRRKKTETKRNQSFVTGAKTESFLPLGPAELERWLVAEARVRSGAIELPAARRLIELVGVDTWRLTNELDKLLSYAGRRPVTIDDVELLSVGRMTSDIFGFLDAVGQQRTGDAIRLLRRELDAGSHPLSLVMALLRHVENLINTISLQPAAPATVARELGLHPYVAQKAVAQVKRFTRPRLVAWHDGLVEIERQLKSTSLDAETLLMNLLVRS